MLLHQVHHHRIERRNGDQRCRWYRGDGQRSRGWRWNRCFARAIHWFVTGLTSDTFVCEPFLHLFLRDTCCMRQLFRSFVIRIRIIPIGLKPSIEHFDRVCTEESARSARRSSSRFPFELTGCFSSPTARAWVTLSDCWKCWDVVDAMRGIGNEAGCYGNGDRPSLLDQRKQTFIFKWSV